MTILEREVYASREEFVRGLRSAFPDELSGGPSVFEVQSRDAAMRVTLHATAPRRLGSMEVPRLLVRIEFTAGTPAARSALLAHMDRAMHRGGG